MKKLFDLIGIDVLSPVDTKRFGTISDIVLVKDGLLKIMGFIVDTDGNSSDFVYIPWYTIRFGDNTAICSQYEPKSYTTKECGPLNGIEGLLRSKDLIDKRVYTNEGKDIGLLKSFFISEDEGLVDGLQCSDGLVNDIINGRTIYPLIGKFELGDDRIILSRESFEEAILPKKG